MHGAEGRRTLLVPAVRLPRRSGEQRRGGGRARRGAGRRRPRRCRGGARCEGCRHADDTTIRSAASAETSAAASVERTQTSGPRRAGSRGVATRRPELVEPVEQPVREAAHVRLDRRHAGLLDERDAGDAGVERRHRRRAGVEPAGAPVRASSPRSTWRRCPRPRTSRSASGRASPAPPAGPT